MTLQRPFSGPIAIRLAAGALAAIGAFSFYSGLSRQVAAGPGGGPSGHVVVIQPQPQIVAWQQGYDRSFGAPAPSAEPARRHRHVEDGADSPIVASAPALAADAVAVETVAREPAPGAGDAPAAPASPPAETPPTAL